MNIILGIKNFIHRHHLTKQASGFILVGIISTVVGYSSFITFLRLFGFHYLVANLGGFICSIGVSYYCNRRWTFKAHDSQYFYRYFSFYLVSFAISSALLKFFVEFCGVIPEIANVFVIGIMTGINFTGVKLLVFKK